MKDKKEKFISKAIKRHGNKYDYSKVEYIDSLTRVCITCPEHGEFWQTPQAHIRGNGCPLCANKVRGKHSSYSEFVESAQKIHGNKYDYSKVEYVNSDTKVCIMCPEHGEFWQRPMAHLNGSGCPKCSGMNRSNDEIITEFKKIHGNKYDYSKVNFSGVNKLVKIICPEHGEFEQMPYKHLIGHGCPKCGIESRRNKQFSTKEEFIEKAIKTHGNKYDYSKVDYVDSKTKVCIVCPKHGEFWQYPHDHVSEHGCPKCGIIQSKSEDEIYEYITKFINKKDVILHDRNLLNGKELDIYIPSKQISIEYNGLKWHSEEYGKDKHYHLSKLIQCNKNGVKLIQIFEDEYIKHKDIVLNKIRHILSVGNNDLQKIMARKCNIKIIEREDAKNFLNKYHIQGYGKSSISYGCFYKNELVAVMSFLNLNHGNWEMVRFASNYNYISCGIGGKLFNYFLKNNNVISVKTFADRRWTIDINNNLYIKIGFKIDKILKPDYYYIDSQNPKERIHKFNFRKSCIHRKYGFPLSMSETQMYKQLGFKKIWNCGLVRYMWISGKQEKDNS